MVRGPKLKINWRSFSKHELWFYGVTCGLIFFVPHATYNHLMLRLPQTQEVFVERENLVKLEEVAFQEVMDSLKRGDGERARTAAEKYIVDYPAGAYHQQAYRVMMGQLEALYYRRKDTKPKADSPN
jgi:hypothetical protein